MPPAETSFAVEGLVLLKLYSRPSLYREGNFTRVGLYENDIATQSPDPQARHPSRFRLNFALILARDMTQVIQIVTEIRERISRFEVRK